MQIYKILRWTSHHLPGLPYGTAQKHAKDHPEYLKETHERHVTVLMFQVVRVNVFFSLGQGKLK